MDININHEQKVTPEKPYLSLNRALNYNIEGLKSYCKRASFKKIPIRVKFDAICLELLEIFNVKIFSKVKNNGIVEDKNTAGLINHNKKYLLFNAIVYIKPVHTNKTFEIFRKVSNSRYKCFNIYIIPALLIIFKNIMASELLKALKNTGDIFKDVIYSYHWVIRG